MRAESRFFQQIISHSVPSFFSCAPVLSEPVFKMREPPITGIGGVLDIQSGIIETGEQPREVCPERADRASQSPMNVMPFLFYRIEYFFA